MLTVGIVQVLALLFGALVYLMVWTQLARRQAQDQKDISTTAHETR